MHTSMIIGTLSESHIKLAEPLKYVNMPHVKKIIGRLSITFLTKCAYAAIRSFRTGRHSSKDVLWTNGGPAL